MSTAAQAFASRENAKLSTGPRTEAGKAVSRLNALRHGATSRAVLVPGEDPAVFQRFETALLADLRPVTDAETTQARRVVSLSWRLQRMYDMEAGVLAHCMDHVNAETFADAVALFTESESEKKFRLFHRYLTSAERAYNKALKDYRDLQRDNREHAPSPDQPQLLAPSIPEAKMPVSAPAEDRTSRRKASTSFTPVFVHGLKKKPEPTIINESTEPNLTRRNPWA